METIVILGLLLALLLLRVPVAFAMGGLGIGLLWYQDLPLVAVPQRLFGAMDSFELLAVPLFLLMSNVLLKGGVGRDLFNAVQAWVGHWPGGLGVATVKSCALFSAISGSSVATAATIGTVAIPEMERRGYKKSFILGQLAAGGTLGILIPPSIPLIIYGVVTETSIAKLFLAGIGPGIFLASAFVVYAMWVNRNNSALQMTRVGWRARLTATAQALPALALAIAILGSIYAGIATPSESAAVGFVLAMLITTFMKRLSWSKLKQAVDEAMITTVMFFVIVAGAKIFAYAITLYLIPQTISNYLTSNISDPALFILLVGLVLLFIGFFLEALSMLLIMVPVLFPALVAMNIDPVWFGIFFVVLVETALITPPVGLNLFVIQAVAKADLEDVVRGAWPFVLIMLSTAILLWFFKGLALYIPYHLA
jgi:C4-dicarboxylate transporter, DctM subunit